MKFSTILLSFFFCVNTFFSQQEITKEHKRLKKETHTEFTLDIQGKLVPSGSKTMKMFSDKGIIIEEIIERFWKDLQKNGVIQKKYYYDSAGRLMYYDLFSDEKFSLKLEYHYDSLGILFKTSEINSKGNQGFYSQKIYDSSGLLKEEHLYKPDGKLYSVKEYLYDAKNNMLEEKGREGKTWKYRWVYKYNKNNQQIERIDYTGEKILLRRHKYDYTSEKIEVETIFNESGDTERVTKYTYEYW